jgi:ankyrin repeat protein
MEVNNVAVMRRRADSWLNATQILKVAGVDKGKRTKILEKEIQTGEHEKVQGGYGKYQGTWIKFERGFEVCQQYGVEEILRPLLTYDMGQDGGVAGRGDINTPTKEQAMAAQRKRTMYASHDPRNGAVSSTFFKSISTTASQAVAAMSKGRFDPSGMRNRLPSSQPAPPRPSFSRQSSMQNADDGPPNSQQSVATEYSAAGGAGGGGGLGNGGGAGGVDPSFGPQGHASGPGGGAVDDQPPRKKQRTTTPAGGSFGYGHGPDGVAAAGGYAGGAYPPPSPTELNDSFYNPSGHGVAAAGGDVLSGRSLPPMQYEDTPEAENVRQQIIQLFVSPDSATDELVSRLSPAQADMPIDSLRNTALHYAASLPRVRVLAMLVALGGNVWRANAEGDTPLMRAVMVTNPFEASVFPELLDITGGTLEARDNKGRTVLHKIALASGLKGRAGSSKYYFESLLEWIVRSGNLQPSTSTAAAAAAASGPKHRASQAPHAMTLARFINEIVDAQDDNGDTALMLAARLKNKSIISQLLEVGADPNIANRSGLRPTTFGVGSPSDKAHGEALALAEANGEPGPQRSKEVADNVQAGMRLFVTSRLWWCSLLTCLMCSSRGAPRRYLFHFPARAQGQAGRHQRRARRA